MRRYHSNLSQRYESIEHSELDLSPIRNAPEDELVTNGLSAEQKRGPPDYSWIAGGHVTFGEWRDKWPENVISMLKDHSVAKLGTFQIHDVDILASFGKNSMLTRGCNDYKDDNVKHNWEVQIEKVIKKNKAFYENKDTGWTELMTVSSYVVLIKDAAAYGAGNMISALLNKTRSKAASLDVWGYPAVRAIIEFKWNHWAKFYLTIQCALHVGWVVSYVLFLLIYIERDLQTEYGDQDIIGKFFILSAGILSSLSFLFMLPSAILECGEFISKGVDWFDLSNVFDALVYMLQIVISLRHAFSSQLETNWFTTLLALHCILIFLKAQYFAAVFTPRGSVVNFLVGVVSKARWYFAFLFVSVISMALSFAVLYKADAEAHLVPDTERDFGGMGKSIVSTWVILSGNFESSYVFEGTNRAVKGLFFLLFQILMSITALNLLISVLSESYNDSVKKEKLTYDIWRARAIEKLELSLSRFWKLKPRPPYIHFIVVDKKEEGHTAEENSDKKLENQAAFRALHEAIQEIKDSVKELKFEAAERQRAGNSKNELTNGEPTAAKTSGSMHTDIIGIKASIEELNSRISELQRKT